LLDRPDPNAVRIGSLRWPVVIASRLQMADPNSVGIVETLFATQAIRADIQPIGAMTFYAAEQVDTPVTHRITIRWLNYPDTTHVVLRQTVLPSGQIRYETFRIRRIAEVDGRKRFLRMDCELEKSV
jgi:head-tail adaptor